MSLVSHKGAAGLARGNSLESILAAQKYKPTFIEIDVHCTADMVFVLHHGPVKRGYSGARLTETYPELKKQFSELLKLEDLLERKDITSALLLDIKCANEIDDLLAYLKQQGLPSSVGFTSPHVIALNKLKHAFPYATTLIAQPYQEGPIKAIEYARDQGFSGISLNKWWLGPLPYFLCRRYGKQIMVYTIDHRLWQWAAQAFFPDIMLCTNHPERYRRSFPITKP